MATHTFLGPGSEWRYDANKPPVQQNESVELTEDQLKMAHTAGISLTEVPAEEVQQQAREAATDDTNSPENLERSTGASEPGHIVEPEPPPTPAEETQANAGTPKRNKPPADK
jgi:hypothetical protein